MSDGLSELPFLQQLFEQDTLYFVPEQENAEPIPVPVQAKALPALTPEKPVVLPVQPQVSVPEPESIPAPTKAAAEISWLGEATKGTYLLFEVSTDVFQELPQHLFLQKVLAAVGLTTRQVKFGNLSSSLVHDVKQIATRENARHIILFGQGLPIANLSKMEFYRMYRLENTRFVLVDALEDIEKSVELKKKLWDVLQKIFLQQN